MSGLPAPVARALDAALVSLPAFHVLDWLVRRHPRPGSVSEAVFATGLHVGEITRAMGALAARGVVVADGAGVQLASAYAPGLVDAWRRMATDRALRRRVVGLAADRDGTEQVVVRVSWAPREGAGPAALMPPSEPGSLTTSVPGARGPSRSAGPAAPAA